MVMIGDEQGDVNLNSLSTYSQNEKLNGSKSSPCSPDTETNFKFLLRTVTEEFKSREPNCSQVREIITVRGQSYVSRLIHKTKSLMGQKAVPASPDTETNFKFLLRTVTEEFKS